MTKSKYIRAKSELISEFLVGLSIAWTAGGIALPFINITYDIRGFITTFFAIVGSLISLKIAIEYKKKII